MHRHRSLPAPLPLARAGFSPAARSRRFPQARYSVVVCLWHAMEKEDVLDGRCTVSLGPQSHSDSEVGLGSPEAVVTRDEESSEEDRPFLPRFLLQEIIFAHSPYEGFFHNQPCLQGNLLCRTDWLRRRGVAETECMILPVRELAAIPRCSVREQLKVEERSSARWSLSAPVLLDELRWQSDPVLWCGSLGRADGPCSGRTDSIYDSEPDLWKWGLDAARNYCLGVPGPVPQAEVPFRPQNLDVGGNQRNH